MQNRSEINFNPVEVGIEQQRERFESVKRNKTLNARERKEYREIHPVDTTKKHNLYDTNKRRTPQNIHAAHILTQNVDPVVIAKRQLASKAMRYEEKRKMTPMQRKAKASADRKEKLRQEKINIQFDPTLISSEEPMDNKTLKKIHEEELYDDIDYLIDNRDIGRIEYLNDAQRLKYKEIMQDLIVKRIQTKRTGKCVTIDINEHGDNFERDGKLLAINNDDIISCKDPYMFLYTDETERDRYKQRILVDKTPEATSVSDVYNYFFDFTYDEQPPIHTMYEWVRRMEHIGCTMMEYKKTNSGYIFAYFYVYRNVIAAVCLSAQNIHLHSLESPKLSSIKNVPGDYKYINYCFLSLVIEQNVNKQIK